MESKLLSPRDNSALAELIRQTFGPSCHIAEYQILKRARDYTVLVARLAQPDLRVVVKLAGLMAALPCPFDRSAAIIRLVRTHTNLPNSGVIAADVTCQRWPWRYMIATYLPGAPWASVRGQLDARQLRDAYQQIGEAVATLHAIPFAQFGEVAPDGTLPFGTPFPQALRERIHRRIRNPRRAEALLNVLWSYPHLFADVGPAGLTHEDLNPTNLLFQQQDGRWLLSGILDFESAWAGSPESDVARLELWQGMIGDGFWEGYAAIRKLPATYPQRRLLYQLIWCAEYDRSTPQHVADTRRICSQLGIPAEPFLS
jgi:aminoglycoside phosphotransferase (APT) family kinase protein